MGSEWGLGHYAQLVKEMAKTGQEVVQPRCLLWTGTKAKIRQLGYRLADFASDAIHEKLARIERERGPIPVPEIPREHQEPLERMGYEVLSVIGSRFAFPKGTEDLILKRWGSLRAFGRELRASGLALPQLLLVREGIDLPLPPSQPPTPMTLDELNIPSEDDCGPAPEWDGE